MKLFQLYLTESQVEKLRRLAKIKGNSMASLIRPWVVKGIAQEEKEFQDFDHETKETGNATANS
jgi:hypothetical protein